MILLGYLVGFGYIFLMIFLIGPLVKKISNLESSRKVIHISLFAVWCILASFFRDSIHQIIIPCAFILLNYLSYRFGIYKSVEREEGNHLGTVYFAIAVAVVMTICYFFPQTFECSGAAILCLTFGDGCAALVGYNTHTRQIRPGKTIAGFVSCAAVSAVSLFVFFTVIHHPISVLMCLLLGILTAVLELTGYGLDNFTVTFGIFAITALYYAFPSVDFTVGLAISLAVFFVVFLSKAITYAGSLLAFLIGFCYMLFGGYSALGFLLGMYICSYISGKLKARKIQKNKEQGRNIWQIICNGLMGLIFICIYGFTKQTGALLISVIAIGGCFIDSLSSDLGILSRKDPYDILKFKPIERGLSGGVSVLGTAAALIGSIVIALAAFFVWKLQLTDLMLITLLIFAQTILDSVFGSALQVKYRCGVCQCITEETEHCGEPTEYLSGVRWINNNYVNAFSSLVITGIAALCYMR